MSSSDVAIDIRGLSKAYKISHGVEKHYTLAEAMLARLRKPLQRPSVETFWALKDVSLQVKRGEVVGIIGRNGAGKSTLLKILSRITEPTSGEIDLYGRVGSLLEVGTGFHPELTGRENIFLNGAILGMRKAEIKKQFDAIVDFAEIEQFIDTPVKRYSSGMYVRLAFSVAAHLNSEILIIDEVLAVGDAAFQSRCLGKMDDVARSGHTVLFVSHNMAAVSQLCSSVVRMERGAVAEVSSDTHGSIAGYLSSQLGADEMGSCWDGAADPVKRDGPFRPLEFYVADDAGSLAVMPIRNDVQNYIYIVGDVRTLDPALNLGVAFYDDSGALLFWSVSTDGPPGTWPALTRGKCAVRCAIPTRLLNEGKYRLEMIASLHHREWICEPGHNAPVICLAISGGLSDSPHWMERRPGALAPVLEWATCEAAAAARSPQSFVAAEPSGLHECISRQAEVK